MARDSLSGLPSNLAFGLSSGDVPGLRPQGSLGTWTGQEIGNSASPVGGGGHVYFVAENGDTVVVKAGRAPEIVARNAVAERALASPAISNGRLFLRTERGLYCIK